MKKFFQALAEKLHADGRFALPEEYKCSFVIEKARLQVGREERYSKTVLDLLMTRLPIARWFKG